MSASHSTMCSKVKTLLCFWQRWPIPKCMEVLLPVEASIVSAMILGMYNLTCLGLVYSAFPFLVRVYFLLCVYSLSSCCCWSKYFVTLYYLRNYSHAPLARCVIASPANLIEVIVLRIALLGMWFPHMSIFL
jgi:hypothetical protein